MNYLHLTKGDDQKNLNVTLTMGEIKILHNACIDILHEHKEMIGYDKVRQSLEDIILYNENRLR